MMKKNLTMLFVLLVCGTLIAACGTADSGRTKDTGGTVKAKVEDNMQAGNDSEAKSDPAAKNDSEAKSDPAAKNDSEVKNDSEAKSDSAYWLCGTGITDGPDYTGGICRMYFKQNTIVLEGNLLKSMSQEDYGEQIGTVETYDGEGIAVSEDCVIVQDEGNEEKTYPYGEYIELREISETDNVAGIYIAVTVKNGKVTEVYFSS